ncbi:MAG: tetratricopeptide repeat protein [Nitrospirae bacterium]|nr:tetratricopeptide repeat protein [Nitrospirota bacterium]
MKRLLSILLTLPLIAGFSPPSGPTDRANEAFAAGRYDDALGGYRKAAEDDPDKAEAYYNLGGAYYKKGEYDRALSEYGKALELDPKMADAYYNSGDALYRLGRYEDALKAYGKADGLRKDEDTKYNIIVTQKKIKKEQEEKNKQAQKGGQQTNQSSKGQNPSGGQQGQEQKQGRTGGSGGQGGQQRMSSDAVQALLDRQAREEKRLRNYFRPGKKDERTREDEIDQMLRGFGLPGLSGRPKPGAPYVEKDW